MEGIKLNLTSQIFKTQKGKEKLKTKLNCWLQNVFSK